MKKLFIVLLIVGLLIPAVSAYDYEETISESTVGWTYPVSSQVKTTGALNREFTQFGVRYIENCKDVILIKFNPNCKFISVPATSQSFEVEFHIDSPDGPVVGRGDYQTWRTNPSDSNGMCQIDFLEWNVDGYTGSHQIYMTKTTGTWVSNKVITTYTSNDINHQIEWQDAAPGTWGKARAILDVYYRDEFKHYYNIDEIGGNYYVNIEKNVDGKPYGSTVYLRDGDNNLMDNPQHTTTDINRILTKAPITLDILGGNNKWYNRTFYSDTVTPDGSGITVYIKNSQTGALIANANVVLDALVDGEYYPVTNRTEPSGIFTITLQPTGGGKPNPDSYRLIVTADGYNNPMPEINFTLGDYIKYFECFLDPIAGGPADENKTFIDFFVRDMSSNPISGATVKFGKYTLITNSAGYTVFEVEKNNNYSWTVSKSGYGALTGNAVIGNDPRHTINTVLAPIVTPTTTTPIPTSPPIGPTPTMTAPTGEPVSNWLEWFAAHFGMILGGGVEIGKIFMWLCFTVPVGVYVGKESKAGAAGFMAGAGIVTLFFVLIGWVPIWLVVLLALIIGLLYAKEFNASDNGGGR